MRNEGRPDYKLVGRLPQKPAKECCFLPSNTGEDQKKKNSSSLNLVAVFQESSMAFQTN